LTFGCPNPNNISISPPPVRPEKSVGQTEEEIHIHILGRRRKLGKFNMIIPAQADASGGFGG